MHKLLILLFFCLTATWLQAQVPKTITLNPAKSSAQPNPDAPDAACFAGTFTPGPIVGQSNDNSLDTIYLCFGDSILIDHNGDQMFMDPDPTTLPGISYVFYNCPPTGTGDPVAVLSDPCLWPGSPGTGFWATSGPPSGDHWFFNTGGLINATTFGNGNPVLIWFAPITVTDHPNGMLEQGCVDVNTNAAFAVVYLKRITEIGPNGMTTVNTNFTDDCKGRFRLRGGFPEWDLNATYKVTIRLASDPSVKALIYTPPAQMKHSTDIIFSVPQPGIYEVIVEDGKSCDHIFQINMASCTSTDNVGISLPEMVGPPGGQVCVPLRINNFTDIIGTSFSLGWDPTVLQFDSVRNPHPNLTGFNPANNLNTNNAGQGFLGILYSDFINANGTTIPSGETMVEVCFTIIAPLDSCSALDIGSFPSLVTMDNAFGSQLAITIDTGSVCVQFIPLEVEFAVGPPTCNEMAPLCAIIKDGAAPFDVTWRQLPNGNGGLVTTLVADTIKTLPLAEGTWEICVTDQNGGGQTVCDTLTIDVPSLGATLAVVQLPSCNGGMNGSLRADVTVDGVTIPPPSAGFTFQWNTVPPQTNQTISNLKAGNYSVIVTNTATGCTAIAAGSLSQPAQIVPDIQITPASCQGISDGRIITTVMGGTPGSAGNEYLFNWEYTPDCNSTSLFVDESGSGNPFTMNNKPAGCYFVTITDGNGCTYVHPVEIEVPNAREVTLDTITIDNPTCFGAANGNVEIQINAQPAFINPAMLFFWNPVPPTTTAGTQTNNGDMSQYSNLAAGTYEVLALETNSGCSVGAVFTLNQPPDLNVATTAKTNPSCSLQNNGSITVAGTGGTPNYVFTWTANPPVVLPSGTNQQNLTPGTYTVTITDANGCKDSLTIALPLPPPPAITSIDSTSIVCGADGCLTVNAPTAVGFNWTTLSGLPIGNTAKVCSLPGDTYVIVINDAQNCVNSDTVTLEPVVPVFFADTLLQQPNCNGGNDGTIALDVQGGNPGYIYKWSGGQSTSVLPAIASGTYTVTVTDLQGCTLVGTFVLPNPPGIIVQYNNIQPATCPGVCDGRVEVVSYYNTVPPTFVNLDFLWEDGSTDSVRTDLCAGFNTVTVTDPVKTCFKIDSLSIDSPPAFVVNFDTIPVTCFGGADGEARVMVSGGNGVPFTYLWNNNSTQPAAVGLMAGDATVTITDKNGCVDTFTTMITQPAEILVNPDFSKTEVPDCFGNSTGTLAVTATGGVPDYNYNWANASGTNVGNENPLGNLPAGIYTVTVTDINGCTKVASQLQLQDPPPVQGTFLPWEDILCFGDETTLVIDTIFGGSGAPYQYSLDFGVFLDAGFQTPLTGGEHYITYIDRQGCEYTDTIFVPEPDQIVVTFDPNVFEIELGDSIQLLPDISGALVADFTWTPAEFVSNPDTLEPFTRTYESQTYTLVVFDDKGCSATGSVQVNIDPNRNVYIPNVFIPAEPKGLNDHFNVYTGRGVEIVNYMRVFDRWGNLMYEREKFQPNGNDFSEGWDGRYKGDYVNPGVYVYVVEVKFLDGRVLLYRGDVTVLR